MIQAMYNGVSGLRAHKTQMDVISNNIANINTIGFKASRVNFREMLSQTVQGAKAPKPGGTGGTNPVQIGLGTSIGSVDASISQGSLISTGKATDVAIEGNGYLILGDGSGKYFTRDGSLTLDSEGVLVSAGSGLKVLGWMADPFTGVIDNAAPISASSAIRLPVGQLAICRQTTSLTYGGNLDSNTAAGGSQIISGQVYDSLGAPHTLTVSLIKTANPSVWDWVADSPDADPAVPVGSGSITFDSNGNCLTSSGLVSLTLALANGATNPIDMSLSFQSITQLAGNTTVSATSQNGLPLGGLDSFSIGKDGVISGSFTNGMSQPLGQMALAQFSNAAGLTKAGNNLLIESSNSGLPQIGQPSEGSLGNITAGFLESSNVDLPTEFAAMIVAQRGFQANSRIITTSDEILQELVQLKR
ncbi:MAG TPA: flagellar hook protein FlgE [Armatimonadota bacterium]|nr:flagellar hook protein FlgE [Armatimonadota bacterium]